MLNSQSNLENYVDFFKFLIEINKQRVKEGKKKIYIIFIINRGNYGIEDAMVEYLKYNNLEELIEVYKEESNEIQNSFIEKYDKKKSGNKQEIKYNIIRINLIKDEESNQQVYF